ncbi:MAG TPA: sigma-70 family RNA polymerase sigma factor [Bryobacteraceae bacterium]|nr:sigma-70 family RNA polymerase sigma factor [Bryobacteraceae bacterium]
MEATDLAAVERTRAGDPAAFRVLVDRYGRSVFRLAYRMTNNEFDAEDVVQETFLRAYKQLDSYESRSSFSTWIYRIAANYSLDLIRSKKRHAARRAPEGIEQEDVLETVRATDPGQDRLYYSAQLRQRLDAALQLLSEQERTAFQLRHFEGQSIEEIGAILGLGVSATKNSIFRAVRKVREALEPAVSSYEAAP